MMLFTVYLLKHYWVR